MAGGLGVLSVTDNGTADTIAAGLGFASVDAPISSSSFRGGAGLFNFVGGTGASTIFGSSGDGTVVGGAGTTEVIGGAGGAVTYVNTTTGGLFYFGTNGNQTVDASLSKGTNSLYGGQSDTTGHNLLIGGAGTDYLNAGAGSDTLVGGGGQDAFFFFKAYGGPAANDVIGDFSAIDSVVLVNYGIGAADAAIAGAATANGSTTITLSDNTTITFTGVRNPAALTGHIFSSP